MLKKRKAANTWNSGNFSCILTENSWVNTEDAKVKENVVDVKGYFDLIFVKKLIDINSSTGDTGVFDLPVISLISDNFNSTRRKNHTFRFSLALTNDNC